MNSDDQYYLLKEIDNDNKHSQRSLAKRLGFSLGKINFLLKALAEKGIIKIENFTQSKHKISYRYILTPTGIKEKARITKAFINRKEKEYEKISLDLQDAKKSLEK